MVDCVGHGWGDQGAGPGGVFAWIHATGSAILTLRVTSEDPVNYPGHWADGRVRPCQGKGCAWCGARIGVQQRFALSAVDLQSGVHSVMEVGLPTALRIRELADGGGGLRGLTMCVSREGGRKRGRLLVHPARDAEDLVGDLPPALDVEAILRATWKRL